MSQQALEIINEYQKITWGHVKKNLQSPVFPKEFRIPRDNQWYEKFHWKIVNDYPLRKGKYLRPTLLLLTYEAMTGKIKEAINTAAAMQLSEEWLLVHDDVEDHSKQRRGKPTLHLKYNNELAINAGDALHILMWKTLNNNYRSLDKSTSQRLMDEFTTMLTRTVIGQTAELSLISKKLNKFTSKDWFFIADGKTSYYTIAGPMRLGAIIANANQYQINKLTLFGLKLGRCFQLVDDILDLTSTFNGLKNQQANDIYEGKRTIMLAHLYNNLDKSGKLKLNNIYTKALKDKTSEDINWVLQNMNNKGSLTYARKVAHNLKNEAMQMIHHDLGFLSDKQAVKKIEILTDFVLNRNH